MDLLRAPMLAAWLVAGCAAWPRSLPPTPVVLARGPGEGASPAKKHDVFTGRASYLSAAFAGRSTASGARFDPEKLTAAHRTLPFGTRIRVVNLANGRKATLTVIDRGPFRKDRILDVSLRAARELGFREAGVARVRVTVLHVPDEDDGEEDEAGGDPR